MNQEYERYIGYIHAPHPKGGKESGTCFFVNANTAIAAAHTFDDTCEPYSLYIHGNEYRFGNSDLRLLDQCAIIELKDTPFESYDSKAVSYNLDFNLNCTTNITWEACGYAIESEEETKRYISGQLFMCLISAGTSISIVLRNVRFSGVHKWFVSRYITTRTVYSRCSGKLVSVSS